MHNVPDFRVISPSESCWLPESGFRPVGTAPQSAPGSLLGDFGWSLSPGFGGASGKLRGTETLRRRAPAQVLRGEAAGVDSGVQGGFAVEDHHAGWWSKLMISWEKVFRDVIFDDFSWFSVWILLVVFLNLFRMMVRKNHIFFRVPPRHRGSSY